MLLKTFFRVTLFLMSLLTFNGILYAQQYDLRVVQSPNQIRYYGETLGYDAIGINEGLDPNATYYWIVVGGSVVDANPSVGTHINIRWDRLGMTGSINVIKMNSNGSLSVEPNSFSINSITATPNEDKTSNYSPNFPYTQSFFAGYVFGDIPIKAKKTSWNIVGGEIINSQNISTTVSTENSVKVKWNAGGERSLHCSITYGHWQQVEVQGGQIITTFISEHEEEAVYIPNINNIATSTGLIGLEAVCNDAINASFVNANSVLENQYQISQIQWQITNADGDFENIPNANLPTYSINNAVTNSSLLRCKMQMENGDILYSNDIAIDLTFPNNENKNYVREFSVLVPGQKTLCDVFSQTIGKVLINTNYSDGLGRSIETVSKGTATPVEGDNQWGDIVSFSVFDNIGRQPKSYLPFTTTVQPGLFKADPLTKQSDYYSNPNTFNETEAYTISTFDETPFNRTINTKAVGHTWHSGNGTSVQYDIFNLETENIPIINIGFERSDIPVKEGVYSSNELSKSISIDEQNKKSIGYINKSGQVIFKKVQLGDNVLDDQIDGWICTYNVYDDFGRLRFTIEPKAVQYFFEHNWDFSTTEERKVLDELCFKYFYDEFGRVIVKKAPGADELKILYDKRGRSVFTQDGNQRKNNQWAFNLYDELDRPIISGLYNSKTESELLQVLDEISNFSNVDLTSENAASQPVYERLVNHRDISVVRYAARNGIEFVADEQGSFESVINDEFLAEIDPDASENAGDITVSIAGSPISQSEINNPSATTVLKYIFYDNYSFTSAKSFESGFSNTNAYSESEEGIESISKTNRTVGFATGVSTRVLGTEIFLNSTSYYDDKGSVIQTLSDNIKSGTDIITNQYHWSGRVMSTELRHTFLAAGFNKYSILTKNNFDLIGRISSIQKKIGNNSFKTIASYKYDDLGKVISKTLDPDYTIPGKSESGIEAFEFSYNIQNQLTGINKNYALKAQSDYDKEKHFFGMFIGYESNDFLNTSNLNGQIAGIIWNTQGDDAQRKYEFEYDNIGRLTKADFKEKQKVDDSWTNNKLNFSIGGNDGGKIKYDLNGNLLSLSHMGLQIGNSSSQKIDDLEYSYYDQSNQLKKVKDVTILPDNENGKLHDFKDGPNGKDADDYVYDQNGNLLLDLNKGIAEVNGGDATTLGVAGIHYNFLDKPDEIHIQGKGVVKFVYDADGNKLQRTFIPEGPNAVPNTTTYIGSFTYQESSTPLTLSSINFEEGRIRLVQPVTESNATEMLNIAGSIELLPGKTGVYDFYIKDNQQNVRMIVTEEVHKSVTTCTMETAENARKLYEDARFGQVQLQNTRVNVADIPGQSSENGWTKENLGNVVCGLKKTSGGDKAIGPNLLLKVMAGDKILASADYYYKDPVANAGSTTSLINSVIHSLFGAISADAAIPGSAKNELFYQNQYSGLPSFTDAIAPDQGDISNTPLAYVTVLFFDERFSFVGAESNRVSQSGNDIDPLVLPESTAPKNGYAFVYLSNESDYTVYFNNFKVSHERGRLIEENHYYAYGLKISAISSNKLSDVNDLVIENKFKYQGNFSEFDGELEWNEFRLRSYDPQVGRWLQSDPYDQFSSPFIGLGNDPVNTIDPSGGWDWFSHQNADGSITHQWYDGKGETDKIDGWVWEGKELDYAFPTSDGRYVHLRDHGKMDYLEFNPQIPQNLRPEKILPGGAQYDSNDPSYQNSLKDAYVFNKIIIENEKDKTFISGTLAITKGDIGTFAYEIEAANVTFGFQTAHDEYDLVSRRDGQVIVMGSDKKGQVEKRTRFGLGVGVVNYNIGYNDNEHPYDSKKVEGFGVGPASFEAVDGKIQNKFTICSAKIAFIVGVEIGIDVNFGETRYAPVPPGTGLPIRESTQAPPILIYHLPNNR